MTSEDKLKAILRACEFLRKTYEQNSVTEQEHSACAHATRYIINTIPEILNTKSKLLDPIDYLAYSNTLKERGYHDGASFYDKLFQLSQSLFVI